MKDNTSNSNTNHLAGEKGEKLCRRHFTPKEASKRLPLVRKIVKDILSRGQMLKMMIEKSPGQKPSAECLDLQAEIEGFIQELEDLGCYYKDWSFQSGLVDFPAVVENQEVFLCWRSDEESLQWYHSLEEGYPGRRLIPQNLLA